MHALDALSVAAAVVQFVDFGADIVSAAREICESAAGGTMWNATLEKSVSALKDISNKLTVSSSVQSQAQYQNLVNLAKESQTICKNLLDILGNIKAKDPSSKRQALVAAIKAKLKEGETKVLAERFDECRKQIVLELQWLTRNNFTTLREQLENISDEAKQASRSVRESIDRLEKSTVVASLSPESKNELQALWQVSKAAEDQVYASRVLGALYNPNMHARFDGVAESHTGTFRWVLKELDMDSAPDMDWEPDMRSELDTDSEPDMDFESEEDLSTSPSRRPSVHEIGHRFTDWLKSGCGFFHIAGKPGSGKSTLMKYLLEHDRTIGLLETWATGQPLVLAKHFFWLPGSKEQKSLRGLLCSLLYESLEQRKEIIPKVFPEEWREARSVAWQANTAIRFRTKALRSAIVRLLQYAESDFHICFFIDGLDEFDDKELRLDHRDLIDLLKEWVSISPAQVKICVSSRELNVFLDAFSKGPRMTLQDLTRVDISKVVRKRLRGYEIDREDLEALISKIVKRADGVFLWVYLVLNSVRQSLDNSYSFEHVVRQVDKTPSDVEQLLDHIFSSISDQEMAFKTITMVQTIAEEDLPEMSTFTYSFLDDYVNDPGFAIKAPVSQYTEHQVAERVEKARRWLIGRCKGLLEVRRSWQRGVRRGWHPMPGTPVEYIAVLHRSLYDFLRTQRTHERLKTCVSDFNSIDAVCQTYLADCKAGFGIDIHKASQFLKLLNDRRTMIPNRYAFVEALDNAILFSEGVDDLPDVLSAVQAETAKFVFIMYDDFAYIITGEKNIPSVMYAQCALGVDEYVKKKYLSSPHLFSSKFSKVCLGICVVHALFVGSGSISGILEILRWLQKEELVSVNDVFPHRWMLDDHLDIFSHDVSLWLWFLVRITYERRRHLNRMKRAWVERAAEAIGVFLNLGADPTFSLLVKANTPTSYTDPEEVGEGTDTASKLEASSPASYMEPEERFRGRDITLTVVHGNNECTDVQTLRQDPSVKTGWEWKRSDGRTTSFWWHHDSPVSLGNMDFIRFISKKGGKVDLTDIVDYLNPENADTLKKLINESFKRREAKDWGNMENTGAKENTHQVESAQKRRNSGGEADQPVRKQSLRSDRAGERSPTASHRDGKRASMSPLFL